MVGQGQILLSQTGRDGCMTIRANIELDSLAACRLEVAWSTALSALAVANDCSKYAPSFRIARLQAQLAIDLYFEEIESRLKRL